MAYTVDIRPILDSLAASRTIGGEIVIEDVHLGEQSFHFEGPVSFEVTLTNTGAGIVAQGSAKVRVRTECVRCLCDFESDHEAQVDGFYVLPGHDDNIPEEQEYEFITDGMHIDLEPAVAGAIVVELPYAPVHDEACKGICARCGRDRNVEECECPRVESASPFAALQGLLGDEDEES